jgi:hypothetical protein
MFQKFVFMKNKYQLCSIKRGTMILGQQHTRLQRDIFPFGWRNLPTERRNLPTERGNLPTERRNLPTERGNLPIIVLNTASKRRSSKKEIQII